MSTPLRIGTRGSSLALRQTEQVRNALARVWPDLKVEVRVIATTGDRVRDRPLAQIGSKGLFTQELEAALLGREIDAAVHSLKDLPTSMVSGLVIVATCERDCPLDALVTRDGARLRDLEPHTVIGTSSLRRRAQILRLRRDLQVIDLRGNVDTRLRKVSGPGPPDGAIMACAGLRRLGLGDRIAEILDSGVMLPAPGQGALAVHGRVDDPQTERFLSVLDCGATRAAVTAERAVLRQLRGGCQVPVGCLGRVEYGVLRLDAGIFSPDGSQAVCETMSGDPGEAELIGTMLADRLLASGAREILDQCSRLGRAFSQ